MKKAYLLLADGTLFEGTAVGYEGQSIGEGVFNTGMAGYQEVLTDPSYYGQVVTMTYPLVGNYGINFDDYESRKSWVSGFIMREMCDSGCAVFFSTHVLDVAERLCDTVSVIRSGRLVASGSMRDIRGDGTLEDAFLELMADGQ